jgi:ribosome-binding factor A
MKSFRVPRLQEELKKMFNIILSQKLRDPKLAWVNVTDVVISKDQRYAKVYFSHYNNPETIRRSGICSIKHQVFSRNK